MNSQADKFLRAVGWMGALAGIAALAGCDPFPSDEAGPLRIDRVMAVDLTTSRVPFTSSSQPGTDVALEGVPLNDALIRIEFNRTLDPTSVQRDPAGTELCRPASNITVTISTTAATPPGYQPRAVQAQVCYSPSGYAPAIVVQPAAAGCGPVALGTLEPGLQYRIAGKGVRDVAGSSLDFTVTVTAAAFAVSDVMVETPDPENPVMLTTGSAEPGTIPSWPLTTSPSTSAVPGTGSYYGPTPDYAVSGRENGFPVYVPPSLDSTAAYGPFIDLFFDSRTCPAGAEALCRGPLVLSVQGQSEPLLVKGTQGGPLDPKAHGLPASTLVVPIFPPEDGQTYTLTVGAGWMDANGGGRFSTQESWVGSFKTPPAADSQGRVVWEAPASTPDASNALPATEYLTLDPKLIQDWTGRPGTGIAGSAPITSGNPALSGPLSSRCADPVPGALVPAAYTGDGRNRTRLFQCANDLLPLQPDSDYAVLANDLVIGGTPIIGDDDHKLFAFRTLPFGNDPTYSGFVNSPQIQLEEGPGPSSHAATLNYEAPSGLVYGPIFSGASADVAVTNGVGNAPVAYLVSLTGKVQYDGGTSLGQSGGFSYHPLTTPSGGTDQAAVWLRRSAPPDWVAIDDPVLEAQAGYVKLGGQDPWTARIYPGSLIGFVPKSPLQYGAGYQLSVIAYAEGSTTPTRVDLDFTTAPFQVTTLRRADLAIFPQVEADPELRRIALGDALTLRTTGLVDGTGFATSGPTTGQAIQMHETATWTEVPVLLQLAANGKYVNVTPSAAALKPGANYTLSVTSRLLATDGTAIQPAKFTFSISDDRLVCE